MKAQWAEPVSLTFHSALRKLNTEPSIGASHQILVHLSKQFQRKKIFTNRPTKDKNCLWQPCLPTDRDEMKNRGPYADASYQVLFHLAKRFQKKSFIRNRPMRDKIACDVHVC
jgi:hypothetical protein